MAKECFCELCGNSKRNKETGECYDMMCYWYSHWQVDVDNPKSVERAGDIRAEIADMNW